ncbi:MAG: PaaI family thioesterase [Parvularculales bacterium]
MPRWSSIVKHLAAGDVSKAPPHIHTLNFGAGQIAIKAPGHVTYDWMVDERYKNPTVVFGGYLSALADYISATTAMTVLKDNQDFTTQDLRVIFFRPVLSGRLLCESKIINQSRSQLFIETLLTLDDGKLAVKASALQRILETQPQ